MNRNCSTIGIALICLCALAMGCKNPMTRSDSLAAKSSMAPDDSSDIKLASATLDKPVTFTDSEKLRLGAGAVDDDAPEEFQMTPSGLRYRVLRKSDGRKPLASNTVTVNYRGWLDNGEQFDSSYEKRAPISFPLTGVIAGWTEGMQLVGEGGMIELWVPARMGYGAKGSGRSVPPNATLHFIVELIKVQ